MALKSNRSIWLAALVALASFVAGFWLAHRLSAPVPIDLNDDGSWSLICSFQGKLNSADGLAAADVYAVNVLSDSRNGLTTLQNKIEISSPRGDSRFMWPSSDDFAATWCQVVDLDGDGSKEFVLIQQGVLARVVAFRSGEFSFREGTRDELYSTRHLVLIDLDSDGQPEFVARGGVPKSGDNLIAQAEELVDRVRVVKWTRDQGFHDAGQDLVARYEREFGAVRKRP